MFDQQPYTESAVSGSRVTPITICSSETESALATPIVAATEFLPCLDNGVPRQDSKSMCQKVSSAVSRDGVGDLGLSRMVRS